MSLHRIVIPRRHNTGLLRLLLAAMLLGCLPMFASAPALAASLPVTRFFAAATGHTVGDPFLQRWIADDGAVTLGNPISEALTSDSGSTQFFQYGVLTRSKSKTSRVPAAAALLAADVASHASGSGLRAFSPLDDAAGQIVPVDPKLNGVAWDKQSHHTISGPILVFYKAHGGAALLGHPLTQAYASGGFTVQWFDNARLQLDPHTGDVTLAPVGFEYMRFLGVTSKPVQRGGLPSFDAARFAKHAGDGTVPDASGLFVPVEIMIPAIGVDAKIEQVDIVNGAMGTPVDAWNVGWYPKLAWPGQYSNVVMAGHRDWWGIGPTVFWSLPDLTAGEMIYLVGADGKGATYKITDSYSVDSNVDAGKVVGDTGADVLTLITCDGSFNGQEYASRQIIRAIRV